ncbi:MAG: head fiber protein, partial [Clostridia bacterium]
MKKTIKYSQYAPNDYVKFWRGKKNLIGTRDQNTIYFITDSGEICIGQTVISNLSTTPSLWRPIIDSSGNLTWTLDMSSTPPNEINIKGITWRPNVDPLGNLSWTQNSSNSNPTTINIKGDTGNTWKPSIDPIGNLSWSISSSTNTPIEVNIKGPKGDKGDIGETGFTWRPSVDALGSLSWTQNSSSTIPSSINIKGPKGDVGATGATWRPSIDSNGLMSWTQNSSSTIPSSYNVKGPKGDTGSKGDTGITWRPNVDSVGLLTWSQNASGTAPSSINIKGPKGDTGSKGDTWKPTGGNITVNSDNTVIVNSAQKSDYSYRLSSLGDLTTSPGDNNIIYSNALTSSTSNLYPSTNNANAVITISTHPGNYFHQLGFSGNSSLYHRNFSNDIISTNPTWRKILDSGNSSVSINGQTLTVKINDTTCSLTNTNTTYNNVTTSTNGLMIASDKVKLDGIAINANNYSLPTASATMLGGIKVGTNLTISNGTLSSINTTYNPVTTSVNGLMIASDKVKLDGIASNANNYSLPMASSTVLGGIKVGSNLSIDINGVLSSRDTNTTYNPVTTTT